MKDACAVSFVEESQIEEFELSETMARFKMISEMEDRGMKGLFNGYGPNGRPKHYKFKTSTISRNKNIFSPTSCVNQHNPPTPEESATI